MTGNANKLKEVRAILSDGSNGFSPIEVEARDVDGARDMLAWPHSRLILIFFQCPNYREPLKKWREKNAVVQLNW